MTDEEVQQLLIEWGVAKGGTVTDQDFAELVATLDRVCPNPETATLAEVRVALGLGPKVAE